MQDAKDLKEEESVAVKGIILCTICEILALLFFYAINV